MNIWQSYKHEGGCLFVHLATTLLKDEEFTRNLEYGEKLLVGRQEGYPVCKK